MKRCFVGLLSLFLAGTACVGCSKGSIPLPNAPHPRLVTFSPALTDIVFDMGLGDHVVGVTSQCNLPDGRERTIVGDAFTVNTEAILAAKPDVVLIQMAPEQFISVAEINPSIRIEHFTIERIDDIAGAAERIGRIVGKEDVGRQAADRFQGELDAVRARVARLPRPRVLFVLGYKDLSTAGKGTFIDEMVRIAGGTNAAAEKYDGWKSLNLEYVLSARPEVLVCWTSPEEENQARAYWSGVKDLPAVANHRVFVVSERDWTIPTLRLADYVSRLAGMIHPALAGGAPK